MSFNSNINLIFTVKLIKSGYVMIRLIFCVFWLADGTELTKGSKSAHYNTESIL